MKAKRISTLEELKQEAGNGADFFILLNGGLRSSKYISWDKEGKVFHVCNLIDDTEQELTEAQVMDQRHTNIGLAMTRGALFKEEY